MSSPFSLFRRHQRVLMVITTGLAMISFVLLGAISDPRDMPMPLVVIFLAAMVGGIFWLAGLSRGKGTDWGLTGVILGVVFGLAMIWSGRESSAVTLEGGNLTGTQLSKLIDQRRIANGFVQMAASAGIPTEGDENTKMQAQFEANQLIQANLFGYLGDNDAIAEDVVFGEILRREASQIGIAISDVVVQNFMQKVSNNKLTKESFSKIRKALQVSEAALMEHLRQELLAREAAELLRSDTFVTPQNQWDFYQKLNVTQSAEVVAIPVSSFVTPAMNPTNDELQNLLNQYNKNLPGFTPEGRPDEGRPGFFQLPKLRLAYLEAVFDDIKATVGDVSDEEIQKKFQEDYLNDIPGVVPGDVKKSDTPTTQPPTLPERTEEPKTEEPKTEESSQSFHRISTEEFQFVSLQDETAGKTEAKPAAPVEAPLAAPVVEKPAPGKVETPAQNPAAPVTAETVKPDPENAKAATPVAEKPATPPAPEKAGAAETPPAEIKTTPLTEGDLPPAPAMDVPELTEELKADIREEILRSRTQKKIVKLMDEAYAFVNELSQAYKLGEFEKDQYISLEDATKKIEAYAAEHNLEYLETPYLTLTELRTSEDYPIGNAFLQSFGDPRGLRSVADSLAESIPSILFNVGQARRFNFNEFGASESRYVYWKTGYKEAYAPKTVDEEESVRQQLVKYWKQQQADATAKARAEKLAELVRQSDKPMPEALGEETVTGDSDSLFLTVRETGEFRMMTQGAAQSTNPFQQQQQGPPRYSVVPGAEDVGERFFKTVFDDLEQGDVGFAPNRDGSVYYLVKIKNRTPSSQAELDEMQARFLNQGDQFAYYYMSSNLLGQYAGDWRRELMDKYGVVFAPTGETVEANEEG